MGVSLDLQRAFGVRVKGVKCFEHIVHRILDWEEIASKGVNETEEIFIGN